MMMEFTKIFILYEVNEETEGFLFIFITSSNQMAVLNDDDDRFGIV